MEPSPAGAIVQPKAGRPKIRAVTDDAAPKRAAQATVPVTALVGRTLFLNGGETQVTFAARDKAVEVGRLTFSGTLIANARETCRIETPATPIAVTNVGRSSGVERVRIDDPTCPITFQVLDGAALVEGTQNLCEFKQAGCQVNPAGLWGPNPGELGPDKAKAIEHARGRAETAVRAAYKSLIAATGKDRAAVMAIAREQAQFSSTREETCREYADEGRHGYCATKLTEARAASLGAKLGEALDAKAEHKRRRSGKSADKPG